MSGVPFLTRRGFAFLIASPAVARFLQEPFKIIDNVDLVLLDVSVRDQHGTYVTDLPQSAFHVFVDGKPQVISSFSR